MLNVRESKQVSHCLCLWGLPGTRKEQSGSYLTPQLTFWEFCHEQGVHVQNRLQSMIIFLMIHGWGRHSSQSGHFLNGWLGPQYTHIGTTLLIILHCLLCGWPGMEEFWKAAPKFWAELIMTSCFLLSHWLFPTPTQLWKVQFTLGKKHRCWPMLS